MVHMVHDIKARGGVLYFDLVIVSDIKNHEVKFCILTSLSDEWPVIVSDVKNHEVKFCTLTSLSDEWPVVDSVS